MIRINLIPVEEAERAAGRRQELAIGSLVLAVVVLVLVMAHVWQSIRLASARRALASLTQQIAAIEGPYGEALRIEQQQKDLREKLRVIGQLEARKVGPVRVLADLSSATPDKLWLTEFADAKGKLKLTGLGADEQTVADFLRRLGTLSLLRNVDLDETSQVDQGGTKLKKFVIRGEIDYGVPRARVANTGKNRPAAGVKKR